MAAHKHSAKRDGLRLAPYRGSAYGDDKQSTAITEIDHCECGARRETNVNGLHVEVGAWYKED